jgi:hypothetical protein
MKTSLLLISIFTLVLVGTQIAPGKQKDAQGKGLQIVDARLGKDVKERAIVDEDSSFAKNSQVFLWMKIAGGSSDSITVTWNTGEYTHAATLVVGGNPWRTWASKTVTKAGEWTVSVTDGSGKMLKEMKFKVE